jgi:hypothetical protein
LTLGRAHVDVILDDYAPGQILPVDGGGLLV